jgi:periplasmic divalent cation tolerance protein
LALKPRTHNIQDDARRTSKVTENFKMTGKIIVLVTCGSAKEARKIARVAVEQRLAACVNILANPMQSIYRWKGKVESAEEFLLIIKTTQSRFAKLQAEVKRLHSYDVPEIIALPVVRGDADYFAWISESVKPSPRKKSKAE